MATRPFYAAPEWFSNWKALRASFANQMAFLTFGIATAALVIAIVSAVQSGNSPYFGLVASTTTALNVTNCNKKILVAIPTGGSTIRLPACRTNATVELVPAVPSAAGGQDPLSVLDSAGNDVIDINTGSSGVMMTNGNRLICSYTSGIGCVKTSG